MCLVLSYWPTSLFSLMMGAGAFNTSKIIAKIHLFLNTTKLFVEKSGKTKENQSTFHHRAKYALSTRSVSKQRAERHFASQDVSL